MPNPPGVDREQSFADHPPQSLRSPTFELYEGLRSGIGCKRCGLSKVRRPEVMLFRKFLCRLQGRSTIHGDIELQNGKGLGKVSVGKARTRERRQHKCDPKRWFL